LIEFVRDAILVLDLTREKWHNVGVNGLFHQIYRLRTSPVTVIAAPLTTVVFVSS
jgi:hypothetical protein